MEKNKVLVITNNEDRAALLEQIQQEFKSQLPVDGRETMFIPGTEIRAGETRAADPDDDPEISINGYGALFNVDANIGGWFIERIAPGAFENTIKNDDIVGLFNHDPDHVLGRTSAKTMELKEDSTGLVYDIKLPDTTTARDVHTSIGRGDIKGSSFSFRTIKDEWEYLDKENAIDGITIIRTLKEVKLYDVGPVTFPAYEQTTSQARSVEKILTSFKPAESGMVPARLNHARRQLELARLY